MEGHETFIEHLAELLLGVPPDTFDAVMDALTSGQVDLSGLTTDDIVQITEHVLGAAAAAGIRQVVKQNAPEITVGLRKALPGT